MLTSYVLWGQSGGMWNYIETRDYNVPAIIYRDTDRKFYSCLKENGPGTPNGVHKPEDGGDYWIAFQPNALMFIDSGFVVRDVWATDTFDVIGDATAKLKTGVVVKIGGKVLDILTASKRDITPDDDGYADTETTVTAVAESGGGITISGESYFKLAVDDVIRIGDADTGITATISAIDGRDLTLISASAEITDVLIGSQVYAQHDAETFTLITVDRHELTAEDETAVVAIAGEYLPLADIVPATDAEVESATGDGYIKASQASLIKPAEATTTTAGIVKLAEIPTD